jgi:hypothetical protein
MIPATPIPNPSIQEGSFSAASTPTFASKVLASTRWKALDELYAMQTIPESPYFKIFEVDMQFSY